MELDKTLFLIEECVKSSKNPVVACSFGKDSLVMLDLVRRVKPDIDVLFFKEPYFRRKHTNAEKIISDWNLTVYEYPPTMTLYLQNGDWFDVISAHYIKGKGYFKLFTGCENYKASKPYVCAVRDLIDRPKIPSYQFKWDCLFHGFKQTDTTEKGIAQAIGLDGKILPTFSFIDDRVLMVLPIKDWDDEDVWRYIRANNLPYNKARYDENNDEFNEDKFPTCANCLDYRYRNGSIYCPLKEGNILSIAKDEEYHKKLIREVTHGF